MRIGTMQHQQDELEARYSDWTASVEPVRGEMNSRRKGFPVSSQTAARRIAKDPLPPITAADVLAGLPSLLDNASVRKEFEERNQRIYNGSHLSPALVKHPDSTFDEAMIAEYASITVERLAERNKELEIDGQRPVKNPLVILLLAAFVNQGIYELVDIEPKTKRPSVDPLKRETRMIHPAVLAIPDPPRKRGGQFPDLRRRIAIELAAAIPYDLWQPGSPFPVPMADILAMAWSDSPMARRKSSIGKILSAIRSFPDDFPIQCDGSDPVSVSLRIPDKDAPVYGYRVHMPTLRVLSCKSVLQYNAWLSIAVIWQKHIGYKHSTHGWRLHPPRRKAYRRSSDGYLLDSKGNLLKHKGQPTKDRVKHKFAVPCLTPGGDPVMERNPRMDALPRLTIDDLVSLCNPTLDLRSLSSEQRRDARRLTKKAINQMCRDKHLIVEKSGPSKWRVLPPIDIVQRMSR